MSVLKYVIKVLVSNKILRIVFSCSRYIVNQFYRIYSYAKYRYYFPESEGGFMHYSTEIKYPENIEIGSNVIIGPGCTLGAHSKILIGNDVRVSKDVTIETAGLDLNTELPYKHKSSPIHIGDGVWLGTKTIVLGGVFIGNHSVIGAGSIISKDIPDYSIVVGHGRIISRRHNK